MRMRTVGQLLLGSHEGGASGVRREILAAAGLLDDELVGGAEAACAGGGVLGEQLARGLLAAAQLLLALLLAAVVLEQVDAGAHVLAAGVEQTGDGLLGGRVRGGVGGGGLEAEVGGREAALLDPRERGERGRRVGEHALARERRGQRLQVHLELLERGQHLDELVDLLGAERRAGLRERRAARAEAELALLLLLLHELQRTLAQEHEALAQLLDARALLVARARHVCAERVERALHELLDVHEQVAELR